MDLKVFKEEQDLKDLEDLEALLDSKEDKVLLDPKARLDLAAEVADLVLYTQCSDTLSLVAVELLT